MARDILPCVQVRARGFGDLKIKILDAEIVSNKIFLIETGEARRLYRNADSLECSRRSFSKPGDSSLMTHHASQILLEDSRSWGRSMLRIFIFVSLLLTREYFRSLIHHRCCASRPWDLCNTLTPYKLVERLSQSLDKHCHGGNVCLGETTVS